MKTKVIIGEKYGKLTPIKVYGRNKSGLLLYLCKCECGKETIVGSRYLTDGRIVSCGCKRARSQKKSNSITYKSWIAAKQRCFNPHNNDYKNYGERGITMCERWKNSFINFINDMGERPAKEYTLDRIDPNGNYEPSNCRWATKEEQSNNRRDNHFICFQDEKLTVSQFSRKYAIGLPYLFYALRQGYYPAEIIVRYKKIQEKKEGRNKA